VGVARDENKSVSRRINRVEKSREATRSILSTKTVKKACRAAHLRHLPHPKVLVGRSSVHLAAQAPPRRPRCSMHHRRNTSLQPARKPTQVFRRAAVQPPTIPSFLHSYALTFSLTIISLASTYTEYTPWLARHAPHHPSSA
jgi:hypothetical protein